MGEPVEQMSLEFEFDPAGDPAEIEVSIELTPEQVKKVMEAMRKAHEVVLLQRGSMRLYLEPVRIEPGYTSFDTLSKLNDGPFLGKPVLFDDDVEDSE